MKKVYAVWEGKRTRDYITPGKKYEAFDVDDYGFIIVSDDGDEIACCWNNSLCLNGGNWTRIEEDEEAPQTEQKTLRDEFAICVIPTLIGIFGTIDAVYEGYKIADTTLEARKK